MSPRQRLEAALRGERVAHAYLLSGPGRDKEETARWFAQAYLCLAAGKERPDPAQPCGVCPSCRLIRAGTHADLRRWEPERGAWRIEQVRALVAESARRATLGRRRAHILVDVHLLNLPAANALLKLLEEPPPGNLFLLLGDEVGHLPSTLLSRCQLLLWGPLAGEPGRYAELARAAVDAACRGKGAHLFSLAKRLGGGGPGQELARQGQEVARELCGMFREELVCRLAGQAGEILGGWEESQLLRAWEAADRLACLLEARANPRLCWEAFLLRLAEVAPTSLVRR